MRMVSPRTGAPEVTIAEDQLEYKPIVCAVYRYPEDDGDFPGVRFLLSRFTFTPEERSRIAAGEDLYIAHITGYGPLQPLAPQVGPDGYTQP